MKELIRNGWEVELMYILLENTVYGEGNGNPLQYSCLENPMDRGDWRATVRGVAKSWTWLSTTTQ